MVDPCQIYIYAQKHPMVFSAPGHEKNRTKIPGQQDYNEFFYEEIKWKIHQLIRVIRAILS